MGKLKLRDEGKKCDTCASHGTPVCPFEEEEGITMGCTRHTPVVAASTPERVPICMSCSYMSSTARGCLLGHSATGYATGGLPHRSCPKDRFHKRREPLTGVHTPVVGVTKPVAPPVVKAVCPPAIEVLDSGIDRGPAEVAPPAPAPPVVPPKHQDWDDDQWESRYGMGWD